MRSDDEEEEGKGEPVAEKEMRKVVFTLRDKITVRNLASLSGWCPLATDLGTRLLRFLPQK